VAAIALAALLSPACAEQPTPVDAAWMELAAGLTAADRADRFVEASALFLGTPYVDGPLGEGEAGGPDPDPRCDFSRADCVTFLEQSLALAVADPAEPESFLHALDRIRYRDGNVDFGARNHYMALDWTPANAWLVEDATAAVGGDAVQVVSRRIDRATFLKERDTEPVPGRDDARDLPITYVPSEAAPRVADAVESGDLVFWVGRKDGIDIVHTGMAVRGDDGTLLFRHGSSRAERVLDEPFLDYAARSGFTIGFVVLRLRG
jgi:hypothetical protein